MIAVATMLYCPPSIPWTDDIRRRLATRHTWVWLKTASEVLADPAHFLGPADFADIRQKATSLHQINRACQVGLYSGGFCPDVHNPHFAWITDADMLHHPDGTPAEIVPEAPPAGYENRRIKTINYARPETRAMLIDQWAQFLASNDLQGVFFDSFNPRYLGAWMASAFGLTRGAAEGPVHTADWWAGSLSRFAADLRARLSLMGAEVWANGLQNEFWDAGSVTDQVTGRSYSGVVDYTDGVLSEHIHRTFPSPSELQGLLTSANLVATRLKQSFFFAQPKLLEYTDPGYVAWKDYDAAWLYRYYLNVYLLAASPDSLFGYHAGDYPYSGFTGPRPHSPYVFDGAPDWDYDFGEPQGPPYLQPDGLWHRRYTNGFAVVNPTDHFCTIRFDMPMRLHDPINGYRFPITHAAQLANWNPKMGGFAWYAPEAI